jgi:hypothetical protein
MGQERFAHVIGSMDEIGACLNRERFGEISVDVQVVEVLGATAADRHPQADGPIGDPQAVDAVGYRLQEIQIPR